MVFTDNYHLDVTHNCRRFIMGRCVTCDAEPYTSKEKKVRQREISKRLRDSRRNRGLCLMCDIPVNGYAHCTYHRRWYTNAHNRRAANRDEVSQCTTCGIELFSLRIKHRRVTFVPYKNCPDCRAKHTIYKQKVRRDNVR